MKASPVPSGLSFDEAATEAKRIVEYGQSKGVLLRLLGALAITLRSIETGKHCFLFLDGRIAYQEKPFTDIDFVGYSRQRDRICKVLEELGYQSRGGFTEAEFGRMVYADWRRGIVVDVFLDTLSMCHTIDFRGRLEAGKIAAPPADLLLSKMQIVDTNEKDVKDSVCLLLDHQVGFEDETGVNCKHIAETLAKDWGFYYTATTNLKKLKDEFAHMYAGKLSQPELQDLHSKIDKILDATENEPKTIGWRVRAKVGPKKKWYQDVEAY